MADTPLRAPSGTEGLRDNDEEKPPVQPPSEESHANVKVVPLLTKELFLHSKPGGLAIQKGCPGKKWLNDSQGYSVDSQ